MEPHLTDVAAVRAGLGFGVLLTLAAAMAQAHADVSAGLIGFLSATAMAALAVPLGYAALLGLSAWGLLTGFVVNAGGQLTFAASDLTHLALLVVLAVAAAVLRPRRAHRPLKARGCSPARSR